MDDSPKDIEITGPPIQVENFEVIKMSSIKLPFFSITIAMMLISSSASASNGTQVIEFPFQEIMYLGDCIQEDAFADEWVTMRTHSFDTPTGVFHSMIKIDFFQMITGLTTGRTWFGANFHNSIIQHVGPGSGSMTRVIVKGVANPVTGDGPKFAWTFHLQVTVTPNGDLVVSKDPDFDSTVKCIGRH